MGAQLNSNATSNNNVNNLPEPEVALLAHSNCLRDQIFEQIEANDGAISLGQYMHMALYQPGLGYYSAGSQKFGEAGDFITAPELGPIFARCLAKSMARVLVQLENPVILELGAGSGQLAYDLLLALHQIDCLPECYQILEVSADLRSRQEDLLATLPKGVKIEWLDRPPQEEFEGIIFGNEVVDALPLERFTQGQSNQVHMDVVTTENQQLLLNSVPATELIGAAVNSLIDQVDTWNLPYHHEIRVDLASWMDSLSRHLSRGAMMFVDYGSDRHELYHPSRQSGTLLCHYRHRAHEQLLLWPGLQDITAWVDFSALADAGLRFGWTLDGYLSQAHWLLDAGLDQVVTSAYEATSEMQKICLAAEVKKLTMPGEMGERFKVMTFSRNLETGMLSDDHVGLERRL